jgi:hypothetical protein
MAGRMSGTCGAASGLFALPLAAACLAATPDRLDESFAADDSGRRPYVTGLVASSVSGPGAAAGDGMGEEMRVRYRQLARLATELGQPAPLRADEPVTLYVDGDDCYAAIEAAIRATVNY